MDKQYQWVLKCSTGYVVDANENEAYTLTNLEDATVLTHAMYQRRKEYLEYWCYRHGVKQLQWLEVELKLG
ncbi:hypothetical protein [Priestia megaterium]|uniref:hypothetical protein n=1 Tax=Priestia megaterium TaxID=1404 RepID=UPI003CC58212